jgi:hypothetical protein
MANEGSNPVAADLNNTHELRAMMRSFSLVATAESIIGRSRVGVALHRAAFDAADDIPAAE